ncbi:hypothetical protein KC963_01520 [Candidatus Saccharibacteria bacterium]|nr:hypothetical protein [Candidatus Saccharibacteria bacterium]
MTKTKQKRAKPEKDSTYFLKLVLLLILGSMWLKVTDGQTWQIPIPVGLILGLLLVMHEHFRIDRKIEYAILLVAALVGFWLPIGIYVTL